MKKPARCLMLPALIGWLAVAFTPSVKAAHDNGFRAYLDKSGVGEAITYTSVIQTNGKIIVGGDFDSADGVTRNNIVRLDPVNGSLDTGFDPDADGPVWGIVIQDDGKILIAGDFTTVGGVSQEHLARLNADGSLDTSFAPVVNGKVNVIAVQADGKVLIGGAFTSVDSSTRNNIARLESDGTLDTVFDPDADQEVYTILVQPDTKILVTGQFTDIAGAAVSYTARLASDGTLDTGFTAPSSIVAPPSVALMPNGQIIVAESVTAANTHVRRLNTDGTLDHVMASFSPRLSMGDAKVNGLTVLASGGIYAAGEFYTGGSDIAVVAISGAYPPSSSPITYVADQKVYGVTAEMNSRILVNGDFHPLNTPGYPPMDRGFIRLSVGNYWDVIVKTSSSRIEFQRGQHSCGTNAVTFELSVDGGTTWTTLGNGTPISGGWELTGLSLPTSGLLRARYASMSGFRGMSRSVYEVVSTIEPDVWIASGNVYQAFNDSRPYNFGKVHVGIGDSTGIYYVQNRGATPLTITGYSFGGANAGDFSMLHGISLPLTLAPYEGGGFFQINCVPTGTGSRSATLNFISNDPSSFIPLQAEAIDPEINITGNGLTIVSTGHTPSLNDHTDFGHTDTPVTRTFTIQNLGTTDLEISEIAGLGGPFALGGITLPTTVAPASQTTFTVTFTPPGYTGHHSSLVAVINNDSNEGYYYFSVAATVGPKINVLGNGIPIASGDVTPSPTDDTDFGPVSTSSTQLVKTYTVQNNGPLPLTLSNISLSGTNAADFAIGGIALPTTVNPNDETTFTVTFDPSALGTRTAKVTVANNAPSQTGYNFTVQGLGVFSYLTGNETIITSSSVTLSGNAPGLLLGYAPQPGTRLMIANNTGINFISGTYADLVHGQEIGLTYGGVTYYFVANYYGGDGNDLVLHWADTRPYGWGENGLGRLGDNTTTDRTSPTAVNLAGVLAGKTVLKVVCGGSHSLALLSDGKVAAWGDNNNGQLGDNSTTARTTPVLVNTTSGVSALHGKTVVSIAAGFNFSLALCSDGTLAAWGDNASRQCGDAATTAADRLVPVLVSQASPSALNGKSVVRIGSGSSAWHSMALCSDGTLVAWGRNSVRCLGNNSAAANHNIPVLVNAATGALVGKSVIDMSAGLNFSVALCSDSSIAAWGENASGRLGNNSTTDAATPVSTSISPLLTGGLTITAIAAGDSHVLALRSDGRAISWGDNTTYGKLGINSTADSLVPIMVNTSNGVSALYNKTVVAIAAGENHSYALCSDGLMTAWGHNNVGQLGIGATTPATKTVPNAVTSGTLVSSQRIISISAGFDHAQAVVGDP